MSFNLGVSLIYRIKSGEVNFGILLDGGGQVFSSFLGHRFSDIRGGGTS